MVVRSDSTAEKRQHLRLKLVYGLWAELRIWEVNGVHAPSGSAKVMVEDIGLGGVRLASSLRFPVDNRYSVRLRMCAAEMTLEATGHIVWTRREDNVHVYGMAFRQCCLTKEQYVRMLNRLLLQQSPVQAKIHTIYHMINRRDRTYDANA